MSAPPSLGRPKNSVRRESRRSPVGANPARPIGRLARSNQVDAGAAIRAGPGWLGRTLSELQAYALRPPSHCFPCSRDNGRLEAIVQQGNLHLEL